MATMPPFVDRGRAAAAAVVVVLVANNGVALYGDAAVGAEFFVFVVSSLPLRIPEGVIGSGVLTVGRGEVLGRPPPILRFAIMLPSAKAAISSITALTLPDSARLLIPLRAPTASL
jgi:hypothetical protein